MSHASNALIKVHLQYHINISSNALIRPQLVTVADVRF